MSYDIWLTIDTGGEEPARVWDNWNYTVNCARMWRAAGVDLAEHEGKTAKDVTDGLYKGIQELESNPEKYKAMNPSNGWGSYESLVLALHELLAAYRRHPLATVRVWR